MSHNYDTFWVGISVLVAMLASYAAFNFAARVRSERGSSDVGWISGGGAILGLGIWSMHSLSMLAFHLSVPVWYNWPLMLLSAGIAVAGSVLAFNVVNGRSRSVLAIGFGAVLMGTTIAAEHYVGMSSMRVDAEISNAAPIVALSIFIAVAMSFAGFWLAEESRCHDPPRNLPLKIIGAVIMGSALSAFHYTAMSGTHFVPRPLLAGSGGHMLGSSQVAAAIVVGAILLILLALTGAAADRDSRTRRQYRNLFEGLPVGVYRSTLDGRMLDANPALVAMLGYPDRESLLATPTIAHYADPADRLRWTAEIDRAGTVRDFDVRKLRKDGVAIWTRDTTHAKRDPSGRIVSYEGILEDITHRVDSEQLLRSSERRLTQILDALPVGVFVCDPHGSPIFANSCAKRMLGKGLMPTLGDGGLAETYSAYVAGTNNYYPNERLPILKALEGEATAVDDMEIRQGNRTISIQVQGAPILDSQGEISAGLAAFTDITEKKALEAQLRHALKMEAVGQLAGGVAHDFNNLLTVIISYGAMLMDRVDPEDPNHEDVREIIAAAERASGLTRQLLAFSRKQVLEPRIMNINAVVTNIENMLRRLIGEDIELETSLDSRVARINADQGQLEQVLMNLVVNARDAMVNGGRVTVSTANARLNEDSSLHTPEAEDREADREYVVLTVRDTGTGMTPEVQQRLFEPFFTTKDHGRGTGLGLSTVYGIVRQSEGLIRVSSEVGHGATFRVYFPRYEGVSEERAVEAVPRDVVGGTETVLVVEDDDNLRALVVRVLGHYGYETLIAASGDEAIRISGDGRTIDAVISDVVLPGRNGREVVARLRESRPGMKYLLISGYTDDDVLRQGVFHGETPFLQKPFTPVQLARKLREVLDGAPARAAAG